MKTLIKLNKSLLKNRKLALLSEPVFFQERLFLRMQLNDFPFLEKLKMVKIIHSNMIEHFTMKMHMGNESVNDTVIDLLESLYEDIEEYLNDLFEEYNYSERIREIRGKSTMTKVFSSDTGKQLTTFATPDIDNIDTVVDNDDITEKTLIKQVIVPKVIMNIGEIIDFIKADGIKEYEYPDGGGIYYPIDYLNTLRGTDIAFRVPAYNYDMVLDFFKQISESPNIKTIVMTLYRFAEDSQILEYLMESKKRYPDRAIAIYMEANARGNENVNSTMAKRLIESGIRVVYDSTEFKVHAKMFLAVCKDGVPYLHTSTGNYNEKTGRIYTDTHLFTSDADKISTAAEILMRLIKSNNIDSPCQSSNHMWFSPVNLKYAIIGLFRMETRKGPEGKIFLKTNSVADNDIMMHIYDAVDAGCQVILVVRSICLIDMNRVKPKTGSLTVVSSCGRYLEHDRIYRFGERIFIGSADLSFRNMHKRIEVMTEIDHPQSRAFIDAMLEQYTDVTNPNLFWLNKKNQWIQRVKGGEDAYE